jgi:hypothetical protein
VALDAGDTAHAPEPEPPGWVQLARRHAGLVWRGARGSEELARPMRLFNVSVPPGGERREGESLTSAAIVPRAPARLTVAGELWTQRLHATITPDAGASRRRPTPARAAAGPRWRSPPPSPTSSSTARSCCSRAAAARRRR